MAESPVETMECPDTKGHIVVVAVDGSEYSDYALEFYVEKVHKPDNHVILVHVVETKSVTSPGITDPSMVFPIITKEIKASEKRADELVETLTAKIKDMKIDAEIERTHGEAGPALVSVTTRKKADFVVIGCRGKGTVRRTLTGSVTDYVTHHSHVPIIIARHIDHIKPYHGFQLKPVNRDRKHKHKDGNGHHDEAEPQDDKGI